MSDITTLSMPYDFTASTYAKASEVNGNNTAITTTVNECVSAINKAATGHTDLDARIDGIDTLIATKSPSASPTFTGTVTLPSTTSIGNVSATEISYVDGVTDNIQNQLNDLSDLVDLKAPIASPTFTGTVTLPAGSIVPGFASLASPTFTGTPKAPTATAGTSSDQIATCAFVSATSFSNNLPGQTGKTGKVLITDGTNADWAGIDLSLTPVTGTFAQFNTAISDADLLTDSSTSTLTNKSINLTNNTLTGTAAEFNTALSDGNFATQAGSETLTNKTINLTNNTISTTKAALNTAVSDGDVAFLDAAAFTASPTVPTVDVTDDSTKTASTAFVHNAIRAGADDYILIQYQTTGTTNDSSIQGSTWTKRNLNTIVSDAGSHSSLASSQITLTAGTYRFKASLPLNSTAIRTAGRLYNATDSTVIAYGLAQAYNNTEIYGRFTITGTKTFELQTYVINYVQDSALALGVSGIPNIYSIIELWKEMA